MTYDYFYGQQAEMFAFYRVPKVLFTEDCFWNVSTDAKLLYGILLDRMNLSARNGWLDEEGRVYIIFTIEEIKGALGCAEKKAVKLLDELEKKCGLIERKRQGLGKPNLIYVKNFISGSVERQFLNCQKDNSGVVKNTIQELSKAQGNNTDTNYIDFSDTDPFFPSGFCGKEADETDEFARYYQYFYEQLSMDYLKQDYPYDHEILDLILHLIIEVMCSKYSEEYYALKAELAELQEQLSAFENAGGRAQKFLKLTERYAAFTDLTPAILNEFISRIEVHERDQKRARYAIQHISIYFNYIGKFENEVTQLAEPTEQEIRQMREEIEEAKKEKSRAYHRQYSREYRARNLEKQREYDRIKAREYRAKKKAQAAAAQPTQ